jgi:selenide,water dikinase
MLVGLSTPDDAAVWRLDESRVLVVTTDFFTPVVDEPYQFGAIAAANSLSDIYAMGAKPFMALNIAAMPVDLDPSIISEIFRGGAEKVKEAGVVIAGGHSVQDKEPKYGLVALGMAEEKDLLTKDRARPNDVLVLTKPLGTGVTTTALMRDKGAPEHEEEAVKWMTLLNSAASELAGMVGVRAATDITGFGLIGHAVEMAEASNVGLEIDFERVPFLSGALKYAELGTFPGGTMDNQKFFRDRVEFAADIAEPEQLLLFDAQTSGGLLMAVPEESIDGLTDRADDIEIPYWRIGTVREGSGIEIVRL